MGDEVTQYTNEEFENAVAEAIEEYSNPYAPDAPSSPWWFSDGFRMNAKPNRKIRLQHGDDVIEREISDNLAELEYWSFGRPAHIPRALNGEAGVDKLSFTLPDFEAEAEALAGGDAVKAPMPGKVIAVNVAVGDAVEKGQVLAVMEAMKMEHSLAAPRDGVVEVVGAELGAQVSEGIVLVGLVAE